MMNAKRALDLNCDLGELAGEAARRVDAELMALISSANIACGFHAGNARIMRRTVELAAQHRVGIGAHPGLADRENFGRRRLAITPDELRDDFTYQIGALAALAHATGQRLQHVKMHGALVEMASEDRSLALAMCEATRRFDAGLIWLAPAGNTAAVACAAGLKAAQEFYIDRAYHANGLLVSRQQPGAVIVDLEEIEDRLAQVLEQGTVTTIEGKVIAIRFDSICIHSDTPDAVKIAGMVCDACSKRQIAIRPLAAIQTDKAQ